MPLLKDLVSRRSDLSTFVVHLTRDSEAHTARQALEAILRTRRIQARNPMGSAVLPIRRSTLPRAALDSQRVVCFTETPLEYLYLLCEEITDAQRTCEFQPYGIAITKRLARMTGINPIWYIDISPGGHDWLMNPINSLIETGIATGRFEDTDIARIAPFIEQMGTHAGGTRKEFWWEREWRHHGPYTLPEHFIVLAPEADHDFFTNEIGRTHFTASYVDPTWSLEEIIARLAGFAPDDIAVF